MLEIAVLCMALSIPHVLYYYVWTQSTSFKKICECRFPKTDPVDVLATMAVTIKVWQYSIFTAWYVATAVASEAWPWPSTWRMLLAAFLLGFGQALNLGLYRAIGKVGVYYGCRLGHSVPWCYGFPFSVCPWHPQYVGSVMSIWGIIVLLWTQTHSVGLTTIANWLTVCYAFSSYVEDNL